MSLRSSSFDFRRAVLFYSGGAVVSSILFIILIGLLTRSYSTGEVGLFFFLTAVSYLIVQIPSGYGKAIQKRMSEGNGWFLSYFVLLSGFLVGFTVLSGIVGLILVMFVVPFNVGEIVITVEVVKGCVVGIFGLGASVVGRYYFGGLSKFGIGEFYMIVTRVLEIGVVFWVLDLFSVSIVGMFMLIRGMDSLRFFVGPVYGFLISEERRVFPSLEQFYDVNRFAVWSIPGDILNDLYHRIDTILLAFFLTSTVVGFYEVGLRLTMLVFAVSMGAHQAIRVKVSGFNEEGRDYTSIVRKSVLSLVVFLSVAFVIVSVFGEEIMRFVYGPEYAVSGAVLILVALFGQLIVQSVRGVYESAFYGLGLPDFNMKIAFITVCLNLALAPWFILNFGGVGMVYATILAESSRLSVFYYFYRRKAKDDGFF